MTCTIIIFYVKLVTISILRLVGELKTGVYKVPYLGGDVGSYISWSKRT